MPCKPFFSQLLLIIYPNSVGRPKHDKVMITTNEQDIFIGEVTVLPSFLNILLG